MAKRTSTTGTSKPTAEASKSPTSNEAPQVKRQAEETAQASSLQTKRSVNRVTGELIAQRAYEIWKSEGGSDLENWLRAEREVQSQASARK